ncbi:hypothetical protein PVAP13_1NG164319 [Panicum virgatum]|uniref:Uncharacterized protein n=1 Tax=Panicum virgatum TaxID=38727 RepID=A0A8T0WWW5_PANVG|nr:hypothetical protein PVAP13_1NG164319 [Panicum virgatum]
MAAAAAMPTRWRPRRRRSRWTPSSSASRPQHRDTSSDLLVLVVLFWIQDKMNWYKHYLLSCTLVPQMLVIVLFGLQRRQHVV